jgi:hypothetical protein
MTKFDLSQIKPIPGFDSLKWKAERQAQILRETAGMTDKEVRERLRQAGDRYERRLAENAERQAAESQT